jgi:hypothetical protein
MPTGEELAGVKRQRTGGSSSRYIGVSWHKPSASWRVQLWDAQAKRLRPIGSYACEDDAARAYDFAVVHADQLPSATPRARRSASCL